jgi:hypothetical protein
MNQIYIFPDPFYNPKQKSKINLGHKTIQTQKLHKPLTPSFLRPAQAHIEIPESQVEYRKSKGTKSIGNKNTRLNRSHSFCFCYDKDEEKE